MSTDFDLLVIGGGINGTGIANLAAQGGLSVLLAEQDDLASHTSSRSSKLIHGGLRYLEHGELRLVREALAEREVLLAMAPHIIWPLTFILPISADTRPAWMIRAGLFFYDHLGSRRTLPGSHRLDLSQHPAGQALKPGVRSAFSYADCWVDDARLVVFNAMQAEAFGASVLTRTRVRSARRTAGVWQVELQCADGSVKEVRTAAIVNAAGPWVDGVRAGMLGQDIAPAVRLVKGSHIVVPRLYQGEQAYLLQNTDGRVVFALPYGAFNLIGTTDVPFNGDPSALEVDEAEVDYLCTAVNRHFNQQIAAEDVRWRYCGVRALYDDGAANASSVTRDYRLELVATGDKTPLLSVFGGKITTYRQLALAALAQLDPFFPKRVPQQIPPPALPGGVLPAADISCYCAGLIRRFYFIPEDSLLALARRHGSHCEMILHGVESLPDLGQDFGAGLYQREVEWLRSEEWAQEVDDVLWRRTKCGLGMTADQRAHFAHWWMQSSERD
jgi:glycerol-3-phosphate dehydrogenase